jgi:hypothetical protein
VEFREDKKAFLRTGWTDLRKQIKGLIGIIHHTISEKMLFSGSYYIFCNKKRNIIKILYWDFDGFCLLQKRYDKLYYWPGYANVKLMEVNVADLCKLLHGINIWKDKGKSKGGNFVMGRIPDKETLDKVIEERNTKKDISIKPQYVDGENGITLYVDQRGLIHKDGPKGDVIDFIGFTEEQLKKLRDNPNGFMPKPN